MVLLEKIGAAISLLFMILALVFQMFHIGNFVFAVYGAIVGVTIIAISNLAGELKEYEE